MLSLSSIAPPSSIEKKVSQKERWRDFFEILFLTFLLALFVRTFFLGFYRVSNTSMFPTLQPGDFVWVSKVAYGFQIPFTSIKLGAELPDKGDLILFRHADQKTAFSIMRVLALPGDHVHLKDQQIKINDRMLLKQKLRNDSLKKLSGLSNNNTNTFESFKEAKAPQNSKVSKISKKLEALDAPLFFQEKNEAKEYIVQYDRRNLDVNQEKSQKQNQEALQETVQEKVQKKNQEIGPLVVPPGTLLVMADCRTQAEGDAPYWFLLSLAQVEAKVQGIWFSLDWSGDSFSAELAHERSPLFRWERLKSF